MENILLFLALFTLTASAVQLSLLRHWWQQIIVTVLIAAPVVVFYPTAIQLGSDDIQRWLTDPGAMLDLAVVLVLEAFIMTLLAAAMVQDMYQPLKRIVRVFIYLRFLPAVTCIGVLCFYLIDVYQLALPYEFRSIAYAYAFSAAIALAIAGWGIRFLIPARVLRLELKLAMHAAQIALAVAIAVLTARYPYRSSEIEPNLVEFAAVILILISGASLGLWWHRRQMKKLQLQTR